MKKRLLKCALLSLLCTTAMGQTATVFNEWTTEYDPFIDSGVLYGLSSNGNYATGWAENTQISLLWTKEGNKLNDIYSPTEETTEHIEALGYDVSDKGTVVGSYWGTTYKDKAGRYCIYPGYRTIDGEWHDIELLSTTVSGGGLAGAIIKTSKDDKVMGGHILNVEGTSTVPAIWKDGVLQKPIVEVPDCKYFIMTAMSEDGSIWAGAKYPKSPKMFTIYDSYNSVIYNNGTLVEIPFEDCPKEVSTARSHVSSISENGKYACGYCYYRKEGVNTSKGFLYNTVTNQFTWIEGIAPTTVTNNGTMYGRDIIDNIMGEQQLTAKARIYEDGELMDLKEYLTSEYNLSTDIVLSDVTGVSEIQDNAFTIAGYTTVAGGNMGRERECHPFVICITLKSEITTTELGVTTQSEKAKITYFNTQMTSYGSFSNISSNNRYIVGGISSAYCFVYDREAGNLKKIIGPDYTYEDQVVQTCDGYAISDDGVIVGNFVCKDSLDENNDACSVAGVYKRNKWRALDRMPNVQLSANGMDGSAKAISADGSIIAGRIATGAFMYSGAKWSASGKITKLLKGSTKGSGGAANHLSADGRVACGWILDSAAGYPAIWVDDELITLGEKEDANGRADCISANGKFVGGCYIIDPDNLPQGSGFIYDTEIKELKNISTAHKDATGIAITGISDNGRIIIGYSMFGSIVVRLPFIIIDGVFHDFDEYIKLLGLETPQFEDLSLFTPIGISGDGKIVHGMADDGYRLPWVIEFKEAPKEQKTAYCYVSGNDKNKVGLGTLDIYSPSEVNIYKKSDLSGIAGAYGNGAYYLILLKSMMPFDGDDDYYPDLVTVDTITGNMSQVGKIRANVMDMSYDYVSKKMFALSFDVDFTKQSLSTIDLSNGNITEIAAFKDASVSYLTLACNSKGELFTIGNDGILYSIDKENGNLTAIGSTGTKPVDFLTQSMEFDLDTDKLYWAAVTDNGMKTGFYEVNVETGTASIISNFTNNDNIVGLYIPYTTFVPTGIYDESYSNNKNNAGINIESNIVSNYIHIMGEYTSVAIYDVAGACILTDTQKAGKVNVSSLSKGIYYVKVMNGSQNATFKVIKK